MHCCFDYIQERPLPYMYNCTVAGEVGFSIDASLCTQCYIDRAILQRFLFLTGNECYTLMCTVVVLDSTCAFR